MTELNSRTMQDNIFERQIYYQERKIFRFRIRMHHFELILINSKINLINLLRIKVRKL